MKYSAKRFISAAMSLLLFLHLSCNGSVLASSQNNAQSGEIFDNAGDMQDADYAAYARENSDEPTATETIRLEASNFLSQDGADAVVREYDGVSQALVWNSMSGSITWEFTVSQTALYEIDLCFEPIKGKDSAIDLGLKLDGAFPFSDAASCKFSRVWQDDSKEILKDEQGNDYTPGVSEVYAWQTASFRDSKGYYGNKPYRFLLTEGKHQLTLICNNECLAIESILLHGPSETQSYEEVYAEHLKSGKTEYCGDICYTQGETPYQKSDQTLRAQYDRNNPLMQPFDAKRIRYNYIGGTLWKYQSQWISWEVDVPEDGFYEIGARYLQDTIKGFSSSRRLYIDGKVPFEEADCISFDYTEDWGLNVFGDGESPYLFYLTKGSHIITLEVVMGGTGTVVNNLQNTTERLMALYRRIIMITGTSPDAYRDYNITAAIPELADELKDAARVLKAEKSNLQVMFNNSSVNVTALQTLLTQIEKLIEDPESIVKASRLNSFSSNISSVSSWLMDLKNQPLAIDYLILKAPSGDLPRVKVGFFEALYNGLISFLYSFVNDYNSVSVQEDGLETITIWIASGRDQMQIIKRMISELFTPQEGVNVDIKLVNASLIQAIQASNGPDVAIMVGRGNPVNLAARNAAVDLSELEGFEELKSSFIASAFVPYEFENGCYGIPDSLEYHMMFYRTDIFEEMGLEVPQTWDDVLKIAPILQRNHMRIGLPYPSADASGATTGIGTRTIYPTLLLQSGIRFYTDDLKKTNLAEEEAYDAFNRWTQFYTLYNFSQSYSFYNLFRTGEMPLGIASYNMYNTLRVASPEIDGLWEMTPVPGTRMPDGTISRAEAANGTASLIFKNTTHLEASWKFIRWWTSAEAQTRYAKDMEAVLGLSGRQSPANIEALQSLSWTNRECQALLEQMNQIEEIPEPVGGYYLIRNIENAFIDTVINAKNARESLNKWSKETDIELERKRREFRIGE